jgi:hypothetical protein
MSSLYSVTFSGNIDEKIGSIKTHKTAPRAQKTLAADIRCVFEGGNDRAAPR